MTRPILRKLAAITAFVGNDMNPGLQQSAGGFNPPSMFNGNGAGALIQNFDTFSGGGAAWSDSLDSHLPQLFLVSGLPSTVFRTGDPRPKSTTNLLLLGAGTGLSADKVAYACLMQRVIMTSGSPGVLDLWPLAAVNDTAMLLARALDREGKAHPIPKASVTIAGAAGSYTIVNPDAKRTYSFSLNGGSYVASMVSDSTP
jgi:hypothetical protein